MSSNNKFVGRDGLARRRNWRNGPWGPWRSRDQGGANRDHSGAGCSRDSDVKASSSYRELVIEVSKQPSETSSRHNSDDHSQDRKRRRSRPSSPVSGNRKPRHPRVRARSRSPHTPPLDGRFFPSASQGSESFRSLVGHPPQTARPSIENTPSETQRSSEGHGLLDQLKTLVGKLSIEDSETKKKMADLMEDLDKQKSLVAKMADQLKSKEAELKREKDARDKARTEFETNQTSISQGILDLNEQLEQQKQLVAELTEQLEPVKRELEAEKTLRLGEQAKLEKSKALVTNVKAELTRQKSWAAILSRDLKAKKAELTTKEKSLLEAKTTAEQNASLASSMQSELNAMKSKLECSICMDAESNHIFLPCGHLACEGCARAHFINHWANQGNNPAAAGNSFSAKCPQCRADIEMVPRKIYFH